MALFSDPPELPVGVPEMAGADDEGFTGLSSSRQIFEYGSAIYAGSIARRDSGDSSTSGVPIVAKRTSGWSLPDELSGFQNLCDEGKAVYLNKCQCMAGGKLHLIGSGPNPFHLFYIPYDLATDTYPATCQIPHLVGFSGDSEPAGLPLCAARSSGNVVVAWGGGSTATTGARYAVISGGVWGAAQTLVATSAGHFRAMRSMVVDASDTAHIFYDDFVGSAVSLYHVSVTSGGSVSTPDLVEGSLSFNYSFGPGELYNGKIVFTGCKAFDANIYLWESDPVTISWTKKTVAARTNDTAGNTHPCPVTAGASLYIMWPENNAAPYPAETATVQYATYDGSGFTAKDAAWHAGDNPYPPGAQSPSGDAAVAFSSMQFSGGKLRMLSYGPFDSSFHHGYFESELYLEVALGPSSRGPRNKFY